MTGNKVFCGINYDLQYSTYVDKHNNGYNKMVYDPCMI